MKNLPSSGGCSCIWNYHQAAGEYTEIDIEMPANGTADGVDWARWAGLNTYWPDERHINEKKQDLGAAQNDGLFHIYRWDWYDGTNGEPKVEFYLDGRLLHTSTANVPRLDRKVRADVEIALDQRSWTARHRQRGYEQVAPLRLIDGDKQLG